MLLIWGPGCKTGPPRFNRMQTAALSTNQGLSLTSGRTFFSRVDTLSRDDPFGPNVLDQSGTGDRCSTTNE